MKTSIAWITMVVVIPLAFGISPPPTYAQNTQLEFWTFIDPAAQGVRPQALRNVIQTFEAGNPGVKVMPQKQEWDQISPSLLRAVQARRVPDVALIYSPYLPLHMTAGTLEPLTKYTARWDAAKRGDWVVPLEQTSYKGQLYGLFYESRVAGFLYRQDILDKEGLKRPASLDELKTLAATLKDKGFIGLPLAFDPQDSFGITIEWVLPLLASLNVPILNADGTAAFNNKGTERVVEWVMGLTQAGVLPKDVAYMGEEQTEQLFVGGKSAILHTDTTRVQAIREKSGAGKAVVFDRPLGFDRQPIPAAVLGWTVVIPKGARNADLAFKFIDHWTSPAMQLADSKIAGYIPARRSVLRDPFFASDEVNFIRFAADYAAAHPFKFNWPTNIDALYITFAKMFQQVIAGQMTPAQGLNWATTEYNTKRTQ